jgi:hypothetical protein
VGLLKTCLMGESASGEDAPVDASLEFETEELVEILEVHNGGYPTANHIIGQGEDKAKYSLDAISFVFKLLLTRDIRESLA